MERLLENDLIINVDEEIARTGLKKINYSISFKGLLYYLSSIENPFTYQLISEPNEDLEAFTMRSATKLKKDRERLEKLLKILEREGKKFDFHILSEIRTLVDRFGQIIINFISDASKRAIAWMTLQFALDNQFLADSEKEIHDRFKFIEKHPEFRYIPEFREIKRGEMVGEEEFFDLKAILEEDLENIEKLKTISMPSQERVLRSLFTQYFIEKLCVIIKKDMEKIPNKKLYNIIKDLSDKKNKEVKRLNKIVEIFEE